MSTALTLEVPMRASTLLVPLALVGCVNRVQERTLDDVEVTTIRRNYANAHLVEVAGHAILVDTTPEANTPEVLEKLETMGVDPAGLDLVIATHAHDDHAGGAAIFQAMGVPVLLGAGDQGMAADGHNDPDTVCPTNRLGQSRLEGVLDASFTPFSPDLTLATDTSISLAELLDDPAVPGTVQSVPGHTEGSVVIELGGAVLVGDLFRGAVGGKGSRVHFYQCDLQDNVEDIRFVLDEVAPEGEVFFPGHFGPLARKRVEALVERMEDDL